MTRRGFLQLASTGLISAAWIRPANAALPQGLDKFTVPGTACANVTPTPAVPDDQTFLKGASERSRLVESGMTGQKLVITGVVKGVVCGPIKGARIDFWQADANGTYDPLGMKLRGYQLTGDNGQYRLETIVPGSYSGRAPRINARIQASGKPALTTALYFPDNKLNPRDPAFKPELVVKVTPSADGLIGTFDFVLNA
jgi:protocatechuate 3,4-dioxygenase beta subunit